MESKNNCSLFFKPSKYPSSGDSMVYLSPIQGEKKFAKKILMGRLEVDVTHTSGGEDVYTVELFNESGEGLYKQLNEYLDEDVIITIERAPLGN